MLCVRVIRADNDRRHLTFFWVVRNHAQLPNVIVYPAAGSSRGKCKQWQRALGILEVRRDDNLLPNVINYSDAISACVKSGRWLQQAIGLLRDVIIAYSTAVSACVKGERGQHAIDLRLAMRNDSVLPDGANYRAAKTACVKRQQ
jgi:hypothetical protein